MPPIKLLTKEQWDRLTPRAQGFSAYIQGGLPGSELRDVTCPYAAGTQAAKDYAAGEFTAMLDAQDGEE